MSVKLRGQLENTAKTLFFSALTSSVGVRGSVRQLISGRDAPLIEQSSEPQPNPEMP